MRKTYMMLVALLAMMLGAKSANAGEIISLQEVPFCTWDGWDATAQPTGDAACAWVVGEPTGQPYGDSGVINYADVSLFAKLIVTVTDGTPRFLFNRDIAEGQWNADESQSHLIDNTQGGWSAKYFTQDGNIYTVDIKQMVKDKGYAHLHAIKGANWANVTVESMELERIGKAQQVGWTNLINNSDMEGDDVSSFFSKVDRGNPEPSVISDGVGVGGSRGIMVAATAKVDNPWDSQFWFRFNEPVEPNAKYRVSFDYRADTDATVSTQAHAEPSDYIWWDMFGNLNFTSAWQTFTKEAEVTTDQSNENKKFLSVAFNLNELADANNYYFDNIKFEVYKYGTTVEYYMDIMQVDFGFDTNIAELVKASGKPRLLFPNDCVVVTANGKPMEVMTVEGFADGRFYIFMEDALEDDEEVVLTFTNPKDPACHLTYTSGPGGDVADFSTPATFNEDVAVDDAYSYIFVVPTVIAADPEDGSFNLPNSIKEFHLTFDKNADLAKLKATLNGKALTVAPAEGFGTEVTLTRTDDADLASGEYILTVTNIFAEEPLVENDFGTYTITLNVGKVEYDPNDVTKDIMPDYFATCQANYIPEGWKVVVGETVRMSTGETDLAGNVLTVEGQNYSGNGARLFDFAEGGDFTKGLYFRTDYVEYGGVPGYELPLEAAKKYRIHFNAAAWKANGLQFMKLEVLDASGNVVAEEMVRPTPDVNGSTGAVNNSLSVNVNFIPSSSENYVVRWYPCINADGEQTTDMVEQLLANPSVKYIPNQVGIEETQLLNTALENAKTVRDENNLARYDGALFDALVAAIDKYEAEAPTYTAPSAYRNAAAALDAAAQAVKDHRVLCDKFDSAAASAMQTVLDNANNKFAKTELYAQLKAVAEKYATAETDENGNVYVEAKVIKDDEVLTVAIAEMADIAAVAAELFTEGESKTGNAGIMELVDRIRQGAEGLKQLGVAEDDELIVAANNALTDNDELAESIKNRLKLEFYGKMKDGGAGLFQPTEQLDDEGNAIKQSYNFTAFVKNPNIYALQADNGYSEENVPGWSVPVGSADLNMIWSHDLRHLEGVPEDMAFTKWHGLVRMEQTVTDLPAGVYNVVIDAVNWAEDDNTNGFCFLKTSSTPAVEEGAEEDQEVNFYATLPLEYHGQYVGHFDNVMSVEVLDGFLTFGCNFGPNSQYMFDNVKIYLTAAANGYDYAKGYEEVLTGVDAAATTAKVRAIEVYDLNGRRLYNAQKGINIVRKQMSDGTIRVEKVIVK